MKKKRSKFLVMQQLSKHQFDGVETFVDQTTRLMKRAWKEYGVWFEKETAGMEKAQIDEFLDWQLDEMVALRDHAPEMLYRAQCVIAYGAFENALAILCRRLADEKRITGPLPQDLNLGKMKTFLKGSIRKRPVPFSSSWQWMHDFRIVRNCIAHSDGRFRRVPGNDRNDKDWIRLQSFLRRNKSLLKMNDRNVISVGEDLADEAIKHSRDALARIYAATKKLYR